MLVRLALSRFLLFVIYYLFISFSEKLLQAYFETFLTNSASDEINYKNKAERSRNETVP